MQARLKCGVIYRRNKSHIGVERLAGSNSGSDVFCVRFDDRRCIPYGHSHLKFLWASGLSQMMPTEANSGH